MGIIIHPTTRQRILFAKNCGDIQFELSGDDAIAREDVPVIGNWEDWTGSGVVPSRAQQMFASVENQLQGQDPNITDKIKLPNLSVIGTNVGTHRRRVKREYMKLD